MTKVDTVVVSTATLRYARMSGSKVRRILGMLRRRKVRDAMDLLRAIPNRAARVVEELISSAAANASFKGHRDSEVLIVSELRADDGPMRKRIRAKSRGMAYVERNRTSHIFCSLSR